MEFAYQRVLLQEDFDRFAALTGDDNPIHCDPEFAATSHFGATVAHGMMLYSCLCKALTEAVGPGVVQIEQTLMFPNPTYTGNRLTVSLRGERGDVGGIRELTTEVTRVGAGETAVESVVTASGVCRVLPPGAELATNISGDTIGGVAGDAELYGLRPGMQASSTRSFTAADLEEYGDLTGDRNPIFRDDAAARERGFTGRIVPWPLLAGMFSDLLGTRLPGRGTGWMKQQLRYPAPAYPGEALTATVSITRLRAGKELVNLSTRIVTADHRLVCDGEALVLVRNLENKGAKP
jgi:acyl dehydratase